MVVARQKAIEIWELCETWLQDSPYLLGDKYTMADVLLQTMLWRCFWCRPFFAEHALSKPKLKKYWEDFRASDDFIKADFFGPGANK